MPSTPLEDNPNVAAPKHGPPAMEEQPNFQGYENATYGYGEYACSPEPIFHFQILRLGAKGLKSINLELEYCNYAM